MDILKKIINAIFNFNDTEDNDNYSQKSEHEYKKQHVNDDNNNNINDDHDDDDDDDDDDDINNKVNNDDNTKDMLLNLNNYTYLFKHVHVFVDEKCSFLLRFVIKNKETWMIGHDLARGVGFKCPNAAISAFVEFNNIKLLNKLLFNHNVDENNKNYNSIKCINLNGAMQLINRAQKTNKAELVAAVLKALNCLPETTHVADEKLNQILKAIEANGEFKTQVINRFNVFEQSIADQLLTLNNKINLLDNIEQLYGKLQEYHKLQTSNVMLSSSSPSPSSSLNIFEKQQKPTLLQPKEFDTTNKNIVKFPKDVSKHPRLHVYAKFSDGYTTLAFLSGQLKSVSTRKRKYEDMELVCNKVHPNPVLALNCIEEELDIQNFSYYKESKRVYVIECDIDAAKSFIQENV
ncbi:38.7K [Trabala vishnou gigantina nucleopolyhedrovirus]|uniref:38.7K n=1 Tax=Trabala vishnou gigantina nucleopolyhedrovirus TaxID=2863583 RepID=UPI002481988A|nr:38.7K [Trabala vishnou gigantina nucleopolyhedrovirus]QYC92683.1 38.7K [Trabala vishnou gigantina nucleopolyhedrovirus]